MKRFILLMALSRVFLIWADVSPLLTMTTEPSIEQLQKWIEEGHDINEKSKEGQTPLMIAAKNKWHQTAQILLDNKAHVNAVDNKGNTALHHTAYNNDITTGQVILSHYKITHQGEHTLTERVIESVTRRFESDYVKINTYNKERKTVLMIAVQEGFLDYVKMLMAYKPSIEAHDSNKQTVLFYAVKNKDLPMVQYLIGQNANLKAKDKDNNMAIHFAVHSKSYSILKALAMNGRSTLNEVSSEFLPPLHTAVMELDTRMVQILLQAGAKADNTQTGEEYKISALALLFILPDVSEDKMVEVTELFISKNANINTIAHSPIEKNTFVHIAINKNYERLLDLLLRAKAKPDVFNAQGRSPLLLAIERKNPNMVRKLLTAGADPNQKPLDIFHFSPLHLSVYHGSLESTEILLNASANVRGKDANGNTALNQALSPSLLSMKTNDVVAQIVQKLINAQSDPNTSNNEGVTPAIHAVMRNNFQALEVLKNNGADLEIADKRGMTVYEHLAQLKQIQPKSDFSKVEKILSDKQESSHSSCEKSLRGPA